MVDVATVQLKTLFNMAGVTFTGRTLSSVSALYLGEIAGSLSSSSIVKNCANYGSVTHSGYVGYAYVGGIIGNAHEGISSDYIVHVQNCINYGVINYNWTTTSGVKL